MKSSFEQQTLLDVQGLKKYFSVRMGLWPGHKKFLKAVDDVSFQLNRGQTLGLVGESGCGKSTLGRAILRLHEPTEGRVVLDGVEVTSLDRKQLKSLRRDMQIIFQDPYASLNPRMTIYEILREPLDIHQVYRLEERDKKILDVLDIVGLRPQILNRYPHEFSGGQRQRIGIARALMLGPKLIVADEPVSALDVSVQSQVLNLILDLQEQFGISFLFIAHDLAVVQHISHEVAVMYLGQIVEKADAISLYRDPKHPYTQSLLAAVPVPDPRRKAHHVVVKGETPSPLNPPSGCPFHPRCPKALKHCSERKPVLRNMASTGRHEVACHLYD